MYLKQPETARSGQKIGLEGRNAGFDLRQRGQAQFACEDDGRTEVVAYRGTYHHQIEPPVLICTRTGLWRVLSLRVCMGSWQDILRDRDPMLSTLTCLAAEYVMWFVEQGQNEVERRFFTIPPSGGGDEDNGSAVTALWDIRVPFADG